MRIITLVIMLVSSGVSGNPLSFEDGGVKRKLLATYEANGENYWCYQPSYQRCMDATLEQCLQRHSLFKSTCLNYAKNNTPQINNSHDVADFSESYAQCAWSNYNQTYLTPTEEKLDCLEKVRIDREILFSKFYETPLN